MSKVKNNAFILILVSVSCGWDRFDRVAEEEGNPIGDPIVFKGGQDLEDCHAECDKESGCYSVTYCKKDNICYLYDKVFYEMPVRITNADCFTSYKSCSGKFRIII